MNVIQKFLITLANRIQEVSSVDYDKNNQKNAILTLDNILLENNVSKNSITGEKLLTFSKDNFAKILEIVGIPEVPLQVKKFSDYKDIISLYQKINLTHGEIQTATQYEEALNWFDSAANYLKEAMVNLVASNNLIKEDADLVSTFKKYQDMFRGDELITPIFNENELEFNNVMILCRLTIGEIAAIKKEIGKANLRLVAQINPKIQDNSGLIEKYRIILSKKQEIYQKDIETVAGLGIDFNLLELENQITSLSNDNKYIPYKNIQNAIVCILLDKEIKKFEALLAVSPKPENIDSLMVNIINNCEKLLAISRIQAPKKVKEKVSISEGLSLIETAQAIIEKEEALLQSINPDDYGRYIQLLTAKNNKSKIPVEAQDKYQLAMLIETLKQEAKAFAITAEKYKENPKDLLTNYQQQLGSIRQYIEVYNLLKKRMVAASQKVSNEETYYKLLYLTNQKGEALITDCIDGVAETYRKITKSIINNLSNGKGANKESAIMINDYVIYNVERRHLTLSYLMLTNDVALIILLSPKNTDIYDELTRVIEENEAAIKNIIDLIKEPDQLMLLLDEQASIRNKLSSYWGSKKKKVA